MSLKSFVNSSLFWTRAAVIAAGLMAAPAAQATLTFVGASGVSSTDLTDMAKPIIYGGFTDGCSGDGANNTAVCDSCIKTTPPLEICSFTNAYDALKVTFTLTVPTTGFVSTDFFAETGSNTITAPENPAVLDSSGTNLTVQLTWAEICKLIGSSSSGCNASFTGEITMGLKNSTATESIVISAKTRNARGSAANLNYQDCKTGAGSNYGVCHFEAFKGDEKLYAEDIVTSDGYPTTAIASGIPYTDVIFFYEGDPAGADDNALVAKINNKSKYVSINVNQLTKKLADNRVSGLQNGTRYCMLAGNRDASGIISHFTPVPGGGGGTSIGELCETPTKVVGLLDDKSCFIATAAFGSSMAPEVESFRQFRNSFLLTNSLGKSLVKAYYKHSPYYASLIAESEVAKALVRVALWPLLLFARMSLVFGFWMTLFFGAGLALSLFEIYRRFFLGRRVRGEL